MKLKGSLKWRAVYYAAVSAMPSSCIYRVRKTRAFHGVEPRIHCTSQLVRTCSMKIEGGLKGQDSLRNCCVCHAQQLHVQGEEGQGVPGRGPQSSLHTTACQSLQHDTQGKWQMVGLYVVLLCLSCPAAACQGEEGQGVPGRRPRNSLRIISLSEFAA